MIIFRYSKLGGAEYISHLDTLRHIGKTLIRAKIPVEYSQGFNPHMQIYLSPPVFVGLKSKSEYCLVETDEKAQSFIEKFNRYSPKNIKCITAFETQKKHKIAGLIDSAEYIFFCENKFDTDKILSQKEIFIDVKGVSKDIRNKIIDLKFVTDNALIARLSFGNDLLRADVFAKYLTDNFTKVLDYEKTDAFISGTRPEDCLE